MWFDWMEVTKLKRIDPTRRERWVAARNEEIGVDLSRRYRCPHCQDIVMSRDFSSVLPDLLLDECPSCGGFWVNGDQIDEMSHYVTSKAETGKLDPREPRAERIVHAVLALFPAACGAGV